MTPDANTLALEISDKLNATGNDYTTKTVNLNDYGLSYEITEHNTGKKLFLTPVEGDLLDMIQYDKEGNILATATLFNEAITEFINLITIRS